MTSRAGSRGAKTIWCIITGICDANESDDEGGDESCPDKQDKYLGKEYEKKLKKILELEGETIERLKTPRGKGAGGYDLYVKPNGDIVVKPKGGAGPGEPTGWNIHDL